MSNAKSKATLSKGRQSWCVIFRHPICLGPDGRQNLRVRRGLGTSEKEHAQALVDELNQILAEPTLWNLASRDAVAQRFNSKIVAAFYDPMLPSNYDPWTIRDQDIPLPGGKDLSDGYARVFFVGTYGAGKTTVVRQLLGTDPEHERFPSTSASKTTICDIEVVLDEGPMRAVVIFIPRDRVRQYISECIHAAVTTKLEGAPERDVVRRFLEHKEQKFRLSYILGNPALLEKHVEDELEDEDDEAHDSSMGESDISGAERDRLLSSLKAYIGAIDHLTNKAKEYMEKTSAELGFKLSEASQEERYVLEEWVEDYLVKLEEFDHLVDAVLDDVETRFDFLPDGEILRGRDGWPIKWTYQESDRSKFIHSVNKFSSNYAPNFGRLLTPLVDGIRVAGPFKPKWHNGDLPKLVLMDGQGIGHTDSTSSLSTSVTSRFRIADAIVLVDNAAQPMQVAPCAVLQSLVTSGHASKLIVAFTHFDAVKADNLPGVTARKSHVTSSFDNAVYAIGKNFGREAELLLRSLIPERLVFLADIQKNIPENAKHTRSELQRLIKAIESSIVSFEPIENKPVYDVANLILAIQKATQEFHDKWNGLLGFGSVAGVRSEHWSRVKALSKRLGINKTDEYDDLRPVADLIERLEKHVSQFLYNPLGWTPSVPQENMKIAPIAAIQREIEERLHDFSRCKVLEERVGEWLKAYSYRGPGSTLPRARDIGRIYEVAAPIPNEIPGSDANKFLFEVRQLIAESVVHVGGQLKGWG